MTAATHLTVGLRFRRSQVRLLRDLANRCATRELPAAAHDLFTKAANATASSEPLIVMCTDETEAIAIADGFTLYGVTRPTIEQVSGIS